MKLNLDKEGKYETNLHQKQSHHSNMYKSSVITLNPELFEPKHYCSQIFTKINDENAMVCSGWLTAFLPVVLLVLKMSFAGFKGFADFMHISNSAQTLLVAFCMSLIDPKPNCDQ